MTIITSGNMKIRSSGRLKAHLGSCVGLAILAPKHHIGGLHHILLPEPVCDVPSSHLASYASTGIPLFLSALAKKGIHPKDMSAYLTGGALVAPSSHADLQMNIGGRTLDIALKHLKQRGIAIKFLEASGIVGFSMVLDVDRATCTVEPVLAEHGKSSGHGMPMPTLIEIGRIIESLQTVPQIALGIASMISNDDIDFSAIGLEIRKDQVLTAEVLRLCRRLNRTSSVRVDTIDEALLILGSRQLLRLLITAQTSRWLSNARPGYSLTRGGLFYHALATARLSEKLAAITGAVRPDLAYTSGLLHDIGKVVLDQFVANDRPFFYRMLRTQNDDLIVLEQKTFGIAHNLAGFHLAERWRLPDAIKDVALFHHHPDKTSRNRELVHIVCLANTMVQRFLPGYVLEDNQTTAFEECLRFLGLTSEQVQESLSVLTDIFQDG